ncbi:MAG: hypothetical protein EPO12_22295 [Aquabacterium sp.]|nr:MAG: hypothetical protein EPO12_22295 [Aquabacterium sp.]
MPTSPPTRNLIVRLCNQVGDVVLSVPALRLLESHGWRLHLVGKPWAASLLAGHGWHCHVLPGKGLKRRAALLRELGAQAARDDAGFGQRPNVLLMPNSFSSALEARWAGLRPTGYARDARGWLLSRRLASRDPRHELVDHWELACAFLGLDLPPPADIALEVSLADQQRADTLIAQHGIRPGFVLLVPFAAGVVDKQDKRWPGFPAFTRELAACGRDLVVCPGPGGEAEIARRDHPGALCLEGLDLGTYCGVLRRAALVVSNDTGPAHMAAGVGTPLLSVLGPTKVEQWGPWSPRAHVVTRHPRWPELADVLTQATLLLAPGARGPA